jgi:hypothetical protein
MDELGGSNEVSENELPDKALHEYDQALEIGRYSDNIIHEVAAIVWGANTLLLGFILEVPCESTNQSLVIVGRHRGNHHVPLCPADSWAGQN